MKQTALLEIKGARNARIIPYLPKEFCPEVGCLQGPIPEGYESLVFIDDCEGCIIDRVHPSPTGEPYYEVHPNV